MKKFIALLLAICIVFSVTLPAFAQEDINQSEENVLDSSEYQYTPTVEEPLSVSATGVPNAAPIKITPKKDGTGVSVRVGNVGVDPLDKVKVTVSATGYSDPKTDSESTVLPVVGETFDFKFPMIKANTTYDAKISITDGGKTKNYTGQASLKISEDSLKKIWNKGTFSSRVASLEYHFKKHGTEVDSTNLIDYLNKATSFRSQVLTSTKNITVTSSSKPTPAKKYKHNIDKRFIYLANSDKLILSFGK